MFTITSEITLPQADTCGLLPENHCEKTGAMGDVKNNLKKHPEEELEGRRIRKTQ